LFPANGALKKDDIEQKATKKTKKAKLRFPAGFVRVLSLEKQTPIYRPCLGESCRKTPLLPLFPSVQTSPRRVVFHPQELTTSQKKRV